MEHWSRLLMQGLELIKELLNLNWWGLAITEIPLVHSGSGLSGVSLASPESINSGQRIGEAVCASWPEEPVASWWLDLRCSYSDLDPSPYQFKHLISKMPFRWPPQ